MNIIKCSDGGLYETEFEFSSGGRRPAWIKARDIFDPELEVNIMESSIVYWREKVVSSSREPLYLYGQAPRIDEDDGA